MAVSPLVAAGRMCELSGWSITNLQLQKMLYIAQMLSLGRSDGDRPLIDGTFEAWDYGPVLPPVYRHVRSFGARPIRNVFRRFREPIQKQDDDVLRETALALGNKSASDLVSLTHREDGAWAKHYEPGRRGIEIPEQDIVHEYRRRITVPASRLRYRRRHAEADHAAQAPVG